MRRLAQGQLDYLGGARDQTETLQVPSQLVPPPELLLPLMSLHWFFPAPERQVFRVLGASLVSSG